MKNSPVNVFTTCSKEGFYEYGERWLNSVRKYWPDSNKRIYTDFDLKLDNDIEVINFNETFPNHETFKKTVLDFYSNKTPKGPIIGKKVIKFSYKAFCIAKELINNRKSYTIWTDADTQLKQPINIDFDELLQNKFLACQIEKKQNRNAHVESGILFFNSNNKLTNYFGELLYDFYTTNKLFTCKKPYDGYVIARILNDYNLNYIDLNEKYNVTNKRSTSDTTFLHPVLKNHFIHWIGDKKY